MTTVATASVPSKGRKRTVSKYQLPRVSMLFWLHCPEAGEYTLRLSAQGKPRGLRRRGYDRACGHEPTQSGCLCFSVEISLWDSSNEFTALSRYCDSPTAAQVPRSKAAAF
jgi:hypothetical protein